MWGFIRQTEKCGGIDHIADHDDKRRTSSMLVVRQVGNAKVEPGVVKLELKITLDPALEELLMGNLDPDQSEMEPVRQVGDKGTGKDASRQGVDAVQAI